VLAEQVPIFRGAFGLSRGQQAVKVEARVRRPKQPTDSKIFKQA
jgi:flagellar motor switch protein FliM